MARQDIAKIIRSFIVDNFLYMRPDFELNNGSPLLAEGIVDSMGVMELVEFIEASFEVRVEDEEVTEDNLGTLKSITDFVVAKGGVGAERQPA